MNEVHLKILSDIHCEIYVDNELKAVSYKNKLTIIPLLKGDYFVQFICVKNSKSKFEQIISLEKDRKHPVNHVIEN